jgi:hypothetical protein
MRDEAYAAATCGDLDMRLVRSLARRLRRGMPANRADTQGLVEDDLVADLATGLWVARQRRPDMPPRYACGVLYKLAARVQRRSARVARVKREAAQLGGMDWFSPAPLNGVRLAEARDLLARLPAWVDGAIDLDRVMIRGVHPRLDQLAREIL